MFGSDFVGEEEFTETLSEKTLLDFIVDCHHLIQNLGSDMFENLCEVLRLVHD